MHPVPWVFFVSMRGLTNVMKDFPSNNTSAASSPVRWPPLITTLFAPISIIISTLAAQAYDGEGGTYDAVIGILDRMSFYIQGNAGAYRIPNPVDEKENFADRWNEEPGRARAFFAWLQQAQEDFYTLSSIHGLDEIGRALESSCGKIVATRTMNAYGEGFQEARNSGELFAASAGLTFSGSPATTVVPRHEFYGD